MPGLHTPTFGWTTARNACCVICYTPHNWRPHYLMQINPRSYYTIWFGSGVCSAFCCFSSWQMPQIHDIDRYSYPTCLEPDDSDDGKPPTGSDTCMSLFRESRRSDQDPTCLQAPPLSNGWQQEAHADAPCFCPLSFLIVADLCHWSIFISQNACSALWRTSAASSYSQNSLLPKLGHHLNLEAFICIKSLQSEPSPSSTSW
jgi:hypothetical protein